MTSTQRLLALPILSALILSACGELEAGIEAFHAGDFERAERLLRKIAQKQAKSDPLVEVSIDENSSLEEVLPHATAKSFDGWQAYAGSLIGLGRLVDGCRATELALRPMRVKVNKRILPERVDPREGFFWQDEVFTLRSWWTTLDCETILGEQDSRLL